MQMVCDYEGCQNGIETGHALYRVSPKGQGQKFIGMCEDHYVGELDPVTKTIQDFNHEQDAKAAAKHASRKDP